MICSQKAQTTQSVFRQQQQVTCTQQVISKKKGLGTVERYTKGADAIAALTSGKIDCVVIDNEPAKAFVEANEGLKILDTEYITEDYAIALAKDSELTESINTALQELKDDGTVQSIIDKYNHSRIIFENKIKNHKPGTGNRPCFGITGKRRTFFWKEYRPGGKGSSSSLYQLHSG